MGPLADFRQHLGQDLNQKLFKLKWIDNLEDNKQKLRTNNSEDDLVIKIQEENVKPIDLHRQHTKHPHKATLKPFK